MGWDAYATKPNGEDLDRDWKNDKLVDPTLDAAFAYAVYAVKKKAGSGADGLLRMGGLDCSDCAYQLQDHSEIVAWSEKKMTPEEVKVAAADPRWDEVPEDKDTHWAFYSAKLFIKTCAAEGLGVRFSF